jgi:hypothetical protein
MMMKRVLAKIALVGVVAAALVSAPQLRAESGEHEDQGLEGSWEIQITQPDLQPLPFGLDYRILRTVTHEGVIDAYAFPAFGPGSPFAPPGGGGPLPGIFANSGHGSWKRAGGPRNYSAVVKYFQLKQDFPNVLHSVGKVTEQIKVSRDGDSYTSTFVTEVFDPAGQLVFTNYGGTIAKRIK